MREEAEFKKLREVMVFNQILNRGIDSPDILEAFSNVPRHFFVPESQKQFAYEDCPLPIGEEQTISQPYIVALMTKALDIKPGMSVLEVGTGSGWQTAILSFLGAKVYSVERINVLAQRAEQALNSLGEKVEIKVGDGTKGWPEYAPYDRIIVTAAAPYTPEPLIQQLKVGGKIVVPVGQRFQQELTVMTKIADDKTKEEKICGCMFVPLIGEYGYKE